MTPTEKELFDALKTVLFDMHGVYGSSAPHGGIGGQTMTLHCSIGCQSCDPLGEKYDEVLRVLYKYGKERHADDT